MKESCAPLILRNRLVSSQFELLESLFNVDSAAFHTPLEQHSLGEMFLNIQPPFSYMTCYLALCSIHYLIFLERKAK